VEPAENPLRFLDGDLRASVFAPSALHDPTFEMRDELHAVADAEDRHPEAHQLGVRGRNFGAVDGRRPTREDDPLRVPRADPVQRPGRRMYLAVDTLLPNPPGDELRELRAVIDDEDAVQGRYPLSIFHYATTMLL